MNKHLQKRRFGKIILSVVVAFLALFMCLSVMAGTYMSASADEVDSIETTDPLDDLTGAVIGGKEFSLDDYPWNENSQPQMIYFAEVGYSIYSNTDDDYALYIYVYNPSGLVFDDSAYNKIEMGFGENPTYDKYTLELLNYSQSGGYEGLFYKFGMYMTATQKSDALRRLSSDARVYTVVSMELSVGGEITDYVVGYDSDTQKGSVYTYTGYALGYGSAHATESSLECTVEGFSRYLALDVEQTVYRPQGDYYLGEQSQLNSCWFTVPTEYIDEYGNLSKIKYEWYEYITKPVLVTENSTIYNRLYALHGDDLANLSDFWFVVSAHGNTDTSWFHNSVDVELYTNADFEGNYYVWWDNGHTYVLNDDKYITNSSNFAAVFYTGGESYEDFYVTGDELQEQLLLNSQYLGDTSVVGKYAAALFEDYVQTGRTLGYNIAENESELEIYWNETTKSSVWQQIFGGYDVDTTYDSVEAFHTVEESDLSGTDSAIAERLYISESDVDALKARYDTATANGETVILFRYGSTDYYSRPVTQSYSLTAGSEDDMAEDILKQWARDEEYSGYVAQQTVFLNFDIISLTFTDENSVSTEIPVVMNPEDVISDLDSPLEENYHEDPPWWVYVLIVFGELIILLLLYFILCTLCGLPKWVWVIILVVVVVLDIFFIQTFAVWLYSLF